MVRTLCILGAERSFRILFPGHAQPLDTTAEDLSQPRLLDILPFLQNTRGFVNPLQYSSYLTVEEALFQLQSEQLRSFPRINFMNRGTDACRLVDSALVWSVEAAQLFPASCRQRARELILIRWREKGLSLSPKFVVAMILPFAIDRYA